MAVTYTDNTQNTGDAVIESREDYTNDKNGKWQYWSDEIKGSQRFLKRWHKMADRIVQRFLDQRVAEASSTTVERESPSGAFKLNLFHSNIVTLLSMAYGHVPDVKVQRRFSDPDDDLGRVAAVIMERLLNNDVATNEEEYDSVLRATLEDRLIPGLGIARVRYDAKTTTKAVGDEIQKTLEGESAPLDYFHWRDVLWSWTRTFKDMRWISFKSHMAKGEVKLRWGNKIAEALEYKQQKMVTDENNNGAPDDPDNSENWLKAEILEIWDKETRKVRWLNMGYDEILETKDDPLKLRDFFPTPPFFIANATTSLYKPTPDFHMAQDLYNEIDKLQTRIAIVTEAVKVVGLYDASTPEIQRMMKEGVENDLIPVDKWAMFAEKGGLQGAIDWFPIADVVAALLQLRQLRDETVSLLYQITGMADIMRGSLDNQYEGVGQSEMKTEFGSVRVQAMQGQYATFATGLMKIKAEIVAKHFDPETIYNQACMEDSLEDRNLIMQAIELIKDPVRARLRVKITAESLALRDNQKLKGERSEYLTALGTFMTSAAPLVEQEPATAPFLLKLLQWGLAGFRGGDDVEGVIDQAIQAVEKEKAMQQGQPDKPDPEMIKAQAAQQLEQMKHQNAMQAIQAKTEADLQIRQADMFADMQTKENEHKMSLAEREADMQAEMATIQAKGETDMQVEIVQSRVNADQQAEGVEAELNKDIVAHRMKMTELGTQHAAKIRETTVAAAVKPIPTAKKDDD